MKPSRRKTRGTSTVFDDVYRTTVQKMPALMIPLINEVFHTDYPEDIAKAQLRNEHLEIQKKLITDSILKSPASQTIFCKAIDGPGKEWMIPWGGKDPRTLQRKNPTPRQSLITIPAAAKELGVSEDDFKKMAML